MKITKLVPEAVLPSKRKGDAGYDLVAVSKNVTESYTEYGTGIAASIPDGYVGLLFPRSSVSKMDMLLANSVGVIDSSYRGEIKARFKRTKEDGNFFSVGDKMCQLVIVPIFEPELELVDTLDETDRGAGGFGSTGK